MNSKDNNKMQQSPLKEKEIHQLQDNKRNVLNDLDYLFTYYASKFSRHNYRELSHKSYMDMMERLLIRSGSEGLINTKTSEERKIQQELLRKVQILYFSKGSKEGATFQQFLQLIPSLGHIIYSQLKSKVEQTEMITKDLLNLYRREVQIKISGKFIGLDLVLEEDTMRYIMKLAPQFIKIYKAYFYHQINRNIKKQNVRDESMKCFFKFIKEFQVFPKLITAGAICLIYKEVLEKDSTEILDQELKDNLPIQQYNKNAGMVFSLGKFITTLVAISKVTNEKIKSSEDQHESQKDMFRSLLQYIEMTKAYKKERHLKDTGKSFSFIILDQYPKELLKQTKALKEGKEGTPRKQVEFIKILKKMEI